MMLTHMMNNISEVSSRLEKCYMFASPALDNAVIFAREWATTIFLLAAITSLLKLDLRQNCKLSHIPGPWILPGIGTVHKIGLNPLKSFGSMGKVYGDIFRISIGSQDVVVLRGLKTIRRALQKSDNFSGRPHLYTFQYLSGGVSLSFSNYDETWKKHKQLAAWSLNRYIAETDAMNTIVQKEALELANNFLSHKGKALDPSKPILFAVGHVLYNMCFGDSRKETVDFEFMVNGTVNLINMHNSGSLVNFMPLARKLLSWKVTEIKDLCQSMCKVASGKEVEHLRTYQSGKHRNILDFLIEASGKMMGKLTESQLLHTCQDFLGAGLDIVQIALTWTILYLAEYEDIQQRLKQELRWKLEPNELPSKEVCARLPFLQAFILEVLRHSSLVPFALPHATTKESMLNGMIIPEDTFVLVDLHSVHKSVDLWGDPDIFRPERFLDASGKLDHAKTDMFIPFSLGRRQCLGQSFAKQEMMMFVAVLLQKSNLKKPDHVSKYDFESHFGLVLRPKPFEVEFHPAVEGRI